MTNQSESRCHYQFGVFYLKEMRIVWKKTRESTHICEFVLNRENELCWRRLETFTVIGAHGNRQRAVVVKETEKVEREEEDVRRLEQIDSWELNFEHWLTLVINPGSFTYADLVYCFRSFPFLSEVVMTFWKSPNIFELATSANFSWIMR